MVAGAEQLHWKSQVELDWETGFFALGVDRDAPFSSLRD